MNDINNEMLILIEKNKNIGNRETTYFSVSELLGPTTRPMTITKKK